MKCAWMLLWAAPLWAQTAPNQAAPNEAPPTGAPAPAQGQTLDSILSATENLNAIRDGYLRRLAGDGCAPDVAVRVAELRARLRAGEGTAAAKKSPTAMSSADMENSLLVLAVSWYTWRPAEPAASKAAGTDAERNRLLASVLAPPEARATVPQADSPAQLTAELAGLLESCRAVKR